MVWEDPVARGLSWPLKQACPWLRPQVPLPSHPQWMPGVCPLCRANVGGGQSCGGQAQRLLSGVSIISPVPAAEGPGEPTGAAVSVGLGESQCY